MKTNSLAEKNILLGVCGGISAYKVLELVSGLKKQGACVKVIMTEAATRFIHPISFEALSKNRVFVGMFDLHQDEVHHIELAKWADIIVIAPATANTIAKIRNGVADNLLTSAVLAARTKLILAPAMNTFMLNNEKTRDNIKALSESGTVFIDTASGLLACGDNGDGRMAEPQDILELIEYELSPKSMIGKTVIVTAGHTVAPIDPVRFLSNHSTGKMGFQVAAEAARRGAKTYLVAGPSDLKTPYGLTRIDVLSTNDMKEAVEKLYEECDVLIKAAAPLDYEPCSYSDKKIKKQSDNMTLEFKRTVDIAKFFSDKKEGRIHVGFAAETNDVETYAKEKIKSKNFDFIVANDVSMPNAGFGTETNIVSIIDNKNNIVRYPVMTKKELASVILDKVEELIK